MANDFLKKEPTKTEKMVYEVVLNQQHLEKLLLNLNRLVIAHIAMNQFTMDWKALGRNLQDHELMQKIGGLISQAEAEVIKEMKEEAEKKKQEVKQ